MPISGGNSTGGGILAISSTQISLDELTTLNSAPIVLTPVPGAGIAIVPVSVSLQFLPGASAFRTSNTLMITYSAQPNIDLMGGLLDCNFTDTDRLIVWATAFNFPSYDLIVNPSIFNNELTATMNGDLGIFGPITALAVTSGGGGLGYAPGDTGKIDGGGDTPGTYTVDTVDIGGVVLTVSILDAAHNYTTSTPVDTYDPSGVGTGLTLDVTVSTPETGIAQIDITYHLITELV